MDAEGQRLLQRLPEWLAQGAAPAVLVTVLATQGSAPRAAGARMVCRDGRLLAGTIGGGHLEQMALRDAAWGAQQGQGDADDALPSATEVHEQADARGRPQRLCRYPLGPKLAQCCGGVVWLHFQEVDAAQARQLAAGVAGAQLTNTALETRFGDLVLRERPVALPAVLVMGAGHVAAALARVLQPLPWRVIVVDSRPEWADAVRFPPGAEVISADPLRLLAAWGWLGKAAQGSQAAQRLAADLRLKSARGLPADPPPASTYALIMTHDHALDRDLAEALLMVPQRTEPALEPLAYVGLIGSKTKIAAAKARLSQRGVGQEPLERLTAPIGLRLDGQLLGGNLPGEIAISVAAQLISLQPRAPGSAAPTMPDDDD